jgi:hypothetical protein
MSPRRDDMSPSISDNIYMSHNILTDQFTSVFFVLQMTSVSRLLHHKNLEPEGPIRTTLDLPPTWPPYGIITFEGTTLQYKEKCPKVLRNFWCCFRAYEKVSMIRNLWVADFFSPKV